MDPDLLRFLVMNLQTLKTNRDFVLYPAKDETNQDRSVPFLNYTMILQIYLVTLTKHIATVVSSREKEDKKKAITS